MNILNYPPTDDLLRQAMAARTPGQDDCSVTVCVNRPWQAQPQKLQVRYVCKAGEHLMAEVEGIRVDLNRAVKLLPVSISKPWGREIWYTGMEARGESRVSCINGSLDLLTYLSLAPDHLCAGAPVLLLKALESRPEPRLGELYFEIHRDKQEVYVVTDINPDSYPDTIGSVRFGMDQAVRRSYPDDAAFRAAFTSAVESYEALRHQADQQAHEDVVQTQSPDEAAARERVIAFTASRPLRRGDVLAVPAGVPHALQHGMRVIEFQTPSYERQIIYSTQKVLTQGRWDSASAIASMTLDLPAAVPSNATGSLIAEFPEFAVHREHLEAGASVQLPQDCSYAVCCPLTGQVKVVDKLGELTLLSGEAAFIPGSAREVTFTATSSADLLIAAPRR